MCSKATHAETRMWAEPTVAAVQEQVEATAADAFVPAEAVFAPARADAHATYVPMGRAARLQEQSEGAALRRRVSFGGVQAPTHYALTLIMALRVPARDVLRYFDQHACLM